MTAQLSLANWHMRSDHLVSVKDSIEGSSLLTQFVQWTAFLFDLAVP